MRMLSSEDNERDFDEAWNPRNKYLADWVFHRDIATYGCEFDFDRSWLSEGFWDAFGAALTCAQALSLELQD